VGLNDAERRHEGWSMNSYLREIPSSLSQKDSDQPEKREKG